MTLHVVVSLLCSSTWDLEKDSFSVPSCVFSSCRERRQTWAEERRMNAETFGIPLRQGRGRGGYRGRGGMGFRGGRGRSASRGSFGPPQGGGGFRGGYRGNQAGREFADLSAYRVKFHLHALIRGCFYIQITTWDEKWVRSSFCIFTSKVLLYLHAIWKNLKDHTRVFAFFSPFTTCLTYL